MILYANDKAIIGEDLDSFSFKNDISLNDLEILKEALFV